jgi:multidrug resistance efflux pump
MKTYLSRPRMFWLLVPVLLVPGVMGAGRLLSGAGNRAPAASPATPTRGPGVVCFGRVDAEPGVVALAPASAGRVVEISVKENDVVTAGAPLIRLDDAAARLLVQEAEADLSAAQELYAQAQKLPEEHQVKVTQQKAAIQVAESRLLAARHLLARKRELFKSQHLNSHELDAAEALVAELAAFEQGERTRLRELELRDPAAGMRRARADVDAKQARLALARRAQEECTLRAPADGTVLRLTARPGEILATQAKEPAVLFCPAGRRIIRAEVDQEFAGQVAVGAGVTIHDDAAAGTRWRGKITRLADWFNQRRSYFRDPTQYSDVRTLECVIELEPNQPPLRIGQLVRAHIGE